MQPLTLAEHVCVKFLLSSVCERCQSGRAGVCGCMRPCVGLTGVGTSISSSSICTRSTETSSERVCRSRLLTNAWDADMTLIGPTKISVSDVCAVQEVLGSGGLPKSECASLLSPLRSFLSIPCPLLCRRLLHVGRFEGRREPHLVSRRSTWPTQAAVEPRDE